VDHADFIRLEIIPVGSFSAVNVDFPDPTLPIVLDSINSTPRELQFDIETLCARKRDCDASLTFEVSLVQDRPADVSVTATFVRVADSSFFFPDNPPFPEDAVVEVRLEP
jgi:hypothetical protein